MIARIHKDILRFAFATAFAVAALSPHPVPAQQASSCMPAEVLMEMTRAHPLYRSHADLPADAVEKAVEIYNTVPPEDDTPWPNAMLVHLADGGGFLLVGRVGLICGVMRLAPAHWPVFLRSILGSGA